MSSHNERQRRTAPGWVRDLTDQQLHGLVGKLHRAEASPDEPFSDRQDWLIDRCLSELEWRAWNDRRNGIGACTCQWCFGSPAAPDGPSGDAGPAATPSPAPGGQEPW